MKTHIVKAGETLTDISRIYYGNSNEVMRIYNANPQLKSGNINIIYVGEIVYIPPSAVDNKKNEEMGNTIDEKNDINVYIDGQSIPIPDDYEIEIFFDTAVDRYQFNFPYEPDNEKYAKLFEPYKLQKVEIFFEKELFFTGIQEVTIFRSSVNKREVVSAGRSLPYLLVKSMIPPSAYPLERYNLNVEQVLKEWLLPVFGLQLQNDFGDVGAEFEVIKAESQDTPWKVISELANQRSIVVSNTPAGIVLLHKPDLKNVVASFELGKTPGIEDMEITYDTTQRFGLWTGQAQSPGDDNITADFQDKEIREQSYNVIMLKDVTKGNIQKALEFQATKSKREAFNMPLNFPDWKNPRTGKYWKAGELINIKAPQVNLKNGKDLLIRSILYKKQAARKYAKMNLIDPESYLDPEN